MSKSEKDVTKIVRLQYAELGVVLWRNNVGAAQDANGNYFRYGLANESRQMNKVIKSSDLIGINPVTITQEMVGQVIGQFIALECKKEGWVFTGTERELAQMKFHDIVNDKGGLASFITGKQSQ